jgi:molecular chaperone GrpE
MSAKIDTNSAGTERQREHERPEFNVVDRRQFLNPEEVDKAAVAEEKPRYPSFVEELVSRMAETERKFEERKAQMQEEIARTKARLEADFARRVGIEKQNMLLPFIEILDNLERALGTPSGDGDGLRRGVEIIVSQFLSKLQAQGVEPIEVLNQDFDPNLGQAVGVVAVPDSSEDGLVKEEVTRGYRIGESVLRPAHVIVGKHS